MTPELIECITATRRIYEGRIVSLREDTATLADGRTVLREVVEHAEVAAVVPVDADGNVILVRQYRLPAREALLEIPAGGAEDGEGIEDAAQRELREEIGYRAGRLKRLCGFFVSPGYCTEFIHVFLATDLIEDSTDGDPDEVIALERVAPDEAVRLIETGEIKDGKSIAGLLLARKRTGGASTSGDAGTIVNP
ncbi:MAG: NUDIX hydrolase [Chloroflexi bacterium]|nr:MAG: NUDIX hydrolase [Chloroflexota bacterium]